MPVALPVEGLHLSKFVSQQSELKNGNNLPMLGRTKPM